MRRICCFCETWGSGGIESFLNNVLLHMDFSEMEVDIVAACIKESVFTSGLKEKGVRFIELSGCTLNLPKNHKMFQKLLKERQYEVVHFNLFQGFSLSYVHQAKLAGIPVRIAHSHNAQLRKCSTRWLKMIFHFLGRALFAKDATALWACSGIAAAFLFPAKLLKERSYSVIPNGIDTEQFRFKNAEREKTRAHLGLSNSFVIGNVGRLCYQKNQEFLLELLAELLKMCPKSKLLLVGTGEDEASLREKAVHLGIQESVIFYGLSNHVEELLWCMDMFVFPSRFEGLGIAVVEAQAAGLPTLCSDLIPKEALVTSLARSIPLECGTRKWAEILLRLDWPGERMLAAQQVRSAGFDVHEVAETIERNYCATRLGAVGRL